VEKGLHGGEDESVEDQLPELERNLDCRVVVMVAAVAMRLGMLREATRIVNLKAPMLCCKYRCWFLLKLCIEVFRHHLI